MSVLKKKDRTEIYEEEVSSADVVAQTLVVMRQLHSGSVKPTVRKTSAPNSSHYTAKFGVRSVD